MIKKAFIMVSLFLMSVLILSACGTLRDTADKNEKLNETLPYYELNTADYSEISYDGTTYVITDICLNRADLEEEIGHVSKRFKNVEVPRKNQRLEKGQEKCDQQIPDVKTVHVGVGCDNDLRITQIVDILLNIQSMHDIEKLFVRVNRVQFQTVTVQRLAAEREYSLVHRIAALFQ